MREIFTAVQEKVDLVAIQLLLCTYGAVQKDRTHLSYKVVDFDSGFHGIHLKSIFEEMVCEMAELKSGLLRFVVGTVRAYLAFLRCKVRQDLCVPEYLLTRSCHNR